MYEIVISLVINLLLITFMNDSRSLPLIMRLPVGEKF